VAVPPPPYKAINELEPVTGKLFDSALEPCNDLYADIANLAHAKVFRCI